MKIGVIGTGSIASFFIQSARLVQGVEVEAVYSRREETGQHFASHNGIGKVYTNLDAMMSDETIDTIYVASPNSLHFEHAKSALMANKHVIVEKPFTGNVERAETLIAIAQKKKLILFEAICNIHMPHFKYIENRIQEVKPLKMVQLNYSQYSSRYDALLQGNVGNVFDPQMSGGALADINIYNVHFAVKLFGMPNAVQYYANLYENGIDTSGVLILDYGTFKATLVGAKDSFSYNLGQIQGENGYILVPNGVNGIESVVLTTKETKKEVVNQDQPRLYYQIEVFKEIVDTRDYKRRDVYLEHSLNVVKVAVEARKQIGLDFEN